MTQISSPAASDKGFQVSHAFWDNLAQMAQEVTLLPNLLAWYSAQ